MKIDDLPAEVRGPAAHLLRDLDGVEIPEPTGWHVLVLIYVRPDKIGSIHMPEQSKREDEFQGTAGMVLAVGPEAYSDKGKFGLNPWCKPGDWIAWPKLESVSRVITYNGVKLALLNDDRVMMTGVDPMRVVAGGAGARVS